MIAVWPRRGLAVVNIVSTVQRQRLFRWTSKRGPASAAAAEKHYSIEVKSLSLTMWIKDGGLVGVFRRGGIRMVLGVAQAEVAFVADTAAIRVDGKEPVEQELKEAFSSRPPDGRAAAVWTRGRSTEGKHGPHLQISVRRKSIHHSGEDCWKLETEIRN